MYYDVKTDKNGIFSVLIHTYTMRDGDANGCKLCKKALHSILQQVVNYPCMICGGLNKEGTR